MSVQLNLDVNDMVHIVQKVLTHDDIKKMIEHNKELKME